MSLVLAADYRVPDFDRWWNRLRGDLPRLPGLGAHHVVVYRAIHDPDHVFVTIGAREREPVDALLRSPLLFAWFDSAGVTEIPPLFAGQIVEKIDLPAPPAPLAPPTATSAFAAPPVPPQPLLPGPSCPRPDRQPGQRGRGLDRVDRRDRPACTARSPASPLQASGASGSTGPWTTGPRC
ncbi:MAG: hypothetical protein WAK82_16860 [Streptosporangiaceae bacterium]